MNNSPVSAASFRDLVESSASPSYQLCIKFTGSGSEYFLIWIVNLLLTLVILSALLSPLLLVAGYLNHQIFVIWFVHFVLLIVTVRWWLQARARRLRYFYRNTVVDDVPLRFYGEPQRIMAMNFIWVMILYRLPSDVDDVMGVLTYLINVAIWPAFIIKSGMQFRLANISWRGLGFRFNGSLAGAYAACAPLFAFVSVSVGLPYFLPSVTMGTETTVLVELTVMLTSFAFLSMLVWNVKKYQYNHCALANHYGLAKTSFNTPAGSCATRIFKTLATFLLVVLLCAVVAFVCIWVTGSGLLPQWMVNAKKGAWSVGLIVVFMVTKWYAISRMKNLIWTSGNASLHFVSTLSFKSLLWLNIKNLFFIIITLGLYWPFAVIALTRLRVEAVSIKTSFDVETMVSHIKMAGGEAVGDKGRGWKSSALT